MLETLKTNKCFSEYRAPQEILARCLNHSETIPLTPYAHSCYKFTVGLRNCKSVGDIPSGPQNHLRGLRFAEGMDQQFGAQAVKGLLKASAGCPAEQKKTYEDLVDKVSAYPSGKSRAEAAGILANHNHLASDQKVLYKLLKTVTEELESILTQCPDSPFVDGRCFGRLVGAFEKLDNPELSRDFVRAALKVALGNPQRSADKRELCSDLMRSAGAYRRSQSMIEC